MGMLGGTWGHGDGRTGVGGPVSPSFRWVMGTGDTARGDAGMGTLGRTWGDMGTWVGGPVSPSSRWDTGTGDMGMGTLGGDGGTWGHGGTRGWGDRGGGTGVTIFQVGHGDRGCSRGHGKRGCGDGDIGWPRGTWGRGAGAGVVRRGMQRGPLCHRGWGGAPLSLGDTVPRCPRAVGGRLVTPFPSCSGQCRTRGTTRAPSSPTLSVSAGGPPWGPGGRGRCVAVMGGNTWPSWGGRQ